MCTLVGDAKSVHSVCYNWHSGRGLRSQSTTVIYRISRRMGSIRRDRPYLRVRAYIWCILFYRRDPVSVSTPSRRHMSRRILCKSDNINYVRVDKNVRRQIESRFRRFVVLLRSSGCRVEAFSDFRGSETKRQRHPRTRLFGGLSSASPRPVVLNNRSYGGTQ